MGQGQYDLIGQFFLLMHYSGKDMNILTKFDKDLLITGDVVSAQTNNQTNFRAYYLYTNSRFSVCLSVGDILISS